MLPTLLIFLFAQRAISFTISEDKELNFTATKLKLRENTDFDLFDNKEEMTLVFNEVLSKGLIPGDY